MNNILVILGASGVFFVAMALRGVFGYLKNKHISLDDLHFSWRKFFGGAITPIALTASIGALAALILAFLKLVGISGLKVAGLDQISLANLEIGLFIADIGAIGYAMKEGLMAFGLSDKQIEQIRSTVEARKYNETTGIKIGMVNDELVAVADNITPKQIIKDKQADDKSRPTDDEIEEAGQGASVNPLSRRLADGKWFGQCSRYSWYLATGIAMNYAPHPDYGPCNGNAMVDYLVSKLGWKRCGKQNGAIFSYNTSTYGHTGMVVDASRNIVNDCNWSPLTVSTHPLNLDAVGAVYACPADMLEAPKPPAPTPQPQPQPKPVDDNVVNAVLRGDYGNGNDRKARLEEAGYNYLDVQRAVNDRASAPAPANARIGDHVRTSDAVDQNGVSLNLAIINDGQSIWTENNDRGMAVLRLSDGTVRCAVKPESLTKV